MSRNALGYPRIRNDVEIYKMKFDKTLKNNQIGFIKFLLYLKTLNRFYAFTVLNYVKRIPSIK